MNKNTKEQFIAKTKKIKADLSSSKYWNELGKKGLRNLNKNRLVLVILIFTIIVGILNPRFWKLDNWLNIVELNTPVAIIAIGMTLVILTSGIDLSVGSVIGLVAATTLLLNKQGVSIPLSIIISILVGALVGFFQGLLVGYLKLVPFIVTLAGMLAFRGITTVALDERSLAKVGDLYLLDFAVENKFIGLSIQTWIFITVSAILIFVLKFTVFGRNIYAIGGNKKASILCGVNAKLVEISVYTILGFLTSISAIMYLSNTQNAFPGMGLGKELDVIAMVVLGGTSLAGGQGSILKTIIGWLILSILYNALLIMGYSTAYQKIFSGAIILVALIFENNKFNYKKYINKIRIKLNQNKKTILKKE